MPSENGRPDEAPVIHVPDRELGAASTEEAPTNGEQPKKKKTRRGSRGGRRRKKPAGAQSDTSQGQGAD